MNFHLGSIAPEVWGQKSLRGVQAPVGGLGDEEAGAVCRHCLQILTAENIKI